MFIFSIIAYFINSFWSARLVNYSVKEQFLDILPAFLFALTLSTCIILPSLFLHLNPIIMLAIQSLLAILLFLLLVNIFKIDSYVEIKNTVVEQIMLLKNKQYGKK